MEVKKTEIKEIQTNSKSNQSKVDSGKIILLALSEEKKFKQPMVCN